MESVITHFAGKTFNDFMAAKPYNEEDDENYMTCKLCSKGAKDLTAMENHLENHFKYCLFFRHNDKDVGVISCSKICDGERRKRNHFHCPYCEQIFTRPTGMKGHMVAYGGKCANKVNKDAAQHSKSDLKRLRGKRDEVFVDADTAVDFLSSQGSFDINLTYFANKTFEDYCEELGNTICPLCPLHLSSQESLKKHLSSIHLNFSVCFVYNEISYCCLPCRQNCQGQRKNRRHHRSHFHCPSCKRTFTRSTSFKNHVTCRIGKCSEQTYSTTTMDEDKTLDQSDLVDKTSAIVSVLIDKGDFQIPQNVKENDENGVISAPSDSSEQDEDTQTTPAKRPRRSSFLSPASQQQETNNLADEMFLKSLLPEMQMVTGERKFKLKMEMMRLIHNAAYKK